MPPPHPLELSRAVASAREGDAHGRRVHPVGKLARGRRISWSCRRRSVAQGDIELGDRPGLTIAELDELDRLRREKRRFLRWGVAR